MRNVKRLAVLVVALCVLGLAGVAYAADIKTPSDIVVALTGKSVEDVNKERADGKTYGAIAKDAGKLEDFKTQMLEQKKAVLDQRVKDGTLTQKQADEIYNRIKTNQALCDGTGKAGIRANCSPGFGQGRGKGSGMGRGAGSGNCAGTGCGMGAVR